MAKRMNIAPGLEEILRLKEEGIYSVVPVSCELLADVCTPIQMVRKLKNVSKHCFLLESAEEKESWGRYTFLGFDPKMSITCLNGRMQAGDVRLETQNPSAVLRQILSEYRSPRMPGLPPFTGGLVGYFAYDYLGYSEPGVRCQVEDTERFQDVDLMLFDKVIAYDNFRQKIILMVNTRLEEGEAGYNRARMELEELRQLVLRGEEAADEPGRLLGEVQPLFDRERFCEMVEKGKHYIREGCASSARVRRFGESPSPVGP